mgnify:CR=1 FL=1
MNEGVEIDEVIDQTIKEYSLIDHEEIYRILLYSRKSINNFIILKNCSSRYIHPHDSTIQNILDAFPISSHVAPVSNDLY